jgi:hypothetical protein
VEVNAIFAGFATIPRRKDQKAGILPALRCFAIVPD